MIVTLVRATTDAVSLAEAKAHCRIDDTESDAVIEGMIAAASEYIAERTALVLQPTTLQYRVDDWPCLWPSRFTLPRGPIRDVTALTYFDEDGVEQTVDAANWSWEPWDDGAEIAISRDFSWPTLQPERSGAIRIVFEAGFNAPDDDATGSDPDLHLPARVRQAILLLVGHWFENRETVTIAAQFSEVPLATERLIETLRVFR